MKLKRRILAFMMMFAMIFTMMPGFAMADTEPNVEWAGYANYNDANNQVTNIALPDSSVYTAEKWAYQLGTIDYYGSYYAGQTVIVDDYLYATGGGKLHKINTANGAGTVISEAAGSTSGSYYDYLCYGDGMLFVSTTDKIEAFDLTGKSLGSVSGSYNYYHPVQYKNGHLICNGYIYKVEKSGDTVSFTKVGSGSIGGAEFNWSNGAFIGNNFYVVDKNTVYAVNYTTGAITDSYKFNADRTASNKSTQGGVSYDAETDRLYWGTYSYNTNIDSVKVNADGTFDKTSYITVDAGQKTVCTPVISGNKVYLAGQNGDIAVHNKADLSLLYNIEGEGGKIQSTPIASTAGGTTKLYFQCYDGHLYMLADNGAESKIEQLAQGKNYSGVKYPNAYEQIAIDNEGRIYFYNESGYLYCVEKSVCEVPQITKDLVKDRVKYAKNATEVTPLAIEAKISDGAGTLSYQWQSSPDKTTWTNVSGAINAEFTPPVDTEGTTYYRCVVTNTKDGQTAQVISSPAYIFVKVLSTDTTLNVMVNGSNTITAGTPAKAVEKNGLLCVENRSAKITNIWLGTVNEGTVESVEVIQGLVAGKAQPKFTSVVTNVYEDIEYLGRWYSNSLTERPLVAKIVVVAEDGVTKKTHYLVVDTGTISGKYAVEVTGFTADSDTYYNSTTGIAFTEKDQTVTLTPVVSGSVGSGTDQTLSWSWSSSDVTVAKVDSNGKVTSVGGGEATITATNGSMVATCKVASTAGKHNTHSYTDGTCTVCGTKEPSAVKVYFSLLGQDGKYVVSKDSTTEIYKAELTVGDADFDGKLTINDAFIVLHDTHSAGGKADFVTEASSYGPYITKLWGLDATTGVGYYNNGESASGVTDTIKKNDVITAFFYRDTTNWADLYTSVTGSEKVVVNNKTTYTVTGAKGIPNGADVKVYDSEGKEVTALATKVNAEGKADITFTTAGDYTLEIGGNATYKTSVWDNTASDYVEKEVTAPVIPSRINVKVLPHVEKTVYVTISTKAGEFAVNKNGDEMYRFPVTASDNVAKPDGVVTIAEILTAAHEQYHPNGASAVGGVDAGFITKLWGEDNGGNASYYFNDVYMSGSGNKTGSNGRQWKDQLLNTVVEDGDSYYIYSFQATSWTKGDLYTYFYPASESAIAGTAKTLTVKSAGGYGSNANKLETSLVKVYDAKGVEQTALNTTVGADGTFNITFPTEGKYTVDVRTNGTNYVTPARCVVHVTAPLDNGGTEENVYISVIDPQGETYKEKTAYSYEAGMTAYSLLEKTGLDVVGSTDHQWGGVYVESIEGLGEFDEGSTSGWMYKVNGEFPDYSASLYALNPGDYVEWVYTRDLGEDVGGGKVETEDEAVNKVIDLISAIGKVDENSGDAIKAARDAYDALTKEQKALVTNYNVLVAAEEAFEALNQEVPTGFIDVPAGFWAEDAINFVVTNGLFNGTSETTFEPNTEMNRAMLVTVLWRLEGQPVPATQNTFADVKAETYYTDAVVWANENGIVTGYTATEFGPDDNVTREQMAAILYRYAVLKGLDVSAGDSTNLLSYTDAGRIAEYAMLAMQWANGEGLITGRTADTLAPQGDSTRAEVATILMRFVNAYAE